MRSGGRDKSRPVRIPAVDHASGRHRLSPYHLTQSVIEKRSALLKKPQSWALLFAAFTALPFCL